MRDTRTKKLQNLSLRPFCVGGKYRIHLENKSLTISDSYKCKFCNKLCFRIYFTGMVETKQCFILISDSDIAIIDATCNCIDDTYIFELQYYHPIWMSKNPSKLGKDEFQFLHFIIDDKSFTQTLSQCLL